MNAEVGNFVIDAVKPRTMGFGCPPIERPAFHDDSAAWALVFDFARRVHALPPLAAGLARTGWHAELPERVRHEIEERIRRERMMLALLDDELDTSLFALTGARIPVIVLKGMDLGRRYYPQRIYRPMTDVDLLVPPESFSDSLRALGKQGYRVVGPFPEGRFRVELGRREGAPVVEVHKFLLAGDTEHSIGGLWSRSRENAVAGLSRHARTLHPEDNLVYLIRHGAVQHLLESPVWLNDLHFLIESRDFQQQGDWDRVIWTLARNRALSGAWLSLNLLAAEWGTKIPAEALKGSGKGLGLVRRRLLSRLARPQAWFPVEGRSKAWVIRSRFLLRDSALDAIKYGIGRERGKLLAR